MVRYCYVWSILFLLFYRFFVVVFILSVSSFVFCWFFYIVAYFDFLFWSCVHLVQVFSLWLLDIYLTVVRVLTISLIFWHFTLVPWKDSTELLFFSYVTMSMSEFRFSICAKLSTLQFYYSYCVWIFSNLISFCSNSTAELQFDYILTSHCILYLYIFHIVVVLCPSWRIHFSIFVKQI